jgi:hypothetical protein
MPEGGVAEEGHHDPTRKDPLPKLSELHLRHRGLTGPLGRSLAEAASVCLARHHEPPVDFDIADGTAVAVREVSWAAPDDRAAAAWANRDDATRDGAYAVAIAAVEAERGLLAVSRAEVRSGADYYMAPAGAEVGDLELAIRLEVSGTDRGDGHAVQRRLRKKLDQARDGASDTPALACVVGFAARRMAMEDLEGR